MNISVHILDGWFKYEKDFEQAEREDKLGAIFTVHYENLKKVNCNLFDKTLRWKLNFNRHLNWSQTYFGWITTHIIFFILLQNPIQETRRLAEFLNVELPDEDIAEISDKCSFQKLKLANEIVKDHSRMPDRERMYELLTKKLYRKGKALFTVLVLRLPDGGQSQPNHRRNLIHHKKLQTALQL